MNHRRKHVKPYGITWNESVADSYTRIGQGRSCTVGVKLPDNLMALESRMKRCVINDTGVVQYYTDPTDSTKKEDGSASSLTGVDGQVMVEVPQGWLKYWYSGTTHNYLISKEQFNGASRFDSHYKNGTWVDKRYIGAYEGTLYDVSAGIYTDGIYQTAVSCVFANTDKSLTIASRTGVFLLLTVGDKIVVSGTTNNNGTKTVASLVSATKITISEAVVNETAAATVVQTEKDWTATTGDKLCSISGKAPINYGMRANFRAVAKNRGTGWRQEDYDLASAINLLYLIEYASFYSQSVIGAGLTDWSSGTWSAYNDYNPINKTGSSNSKGNTTFNLSNGSGVIGSYMTYRGIENWYGHLWKWIDGININNNVPYVSNNDTQFADDTTTNYTALGVTLINADGWQKTLLQQSRGFLPASVGASSSTKITDYYYQYSDWCIVKLGGGAYNGVNAGAFCLDASYASDFATSRTMSGRLAY